MDPYTNLLDWMSQQPEFQTWCSQLPEQISHGLRLERWGDLPQWQAVLEALPDLQASSWDFLNGVRIGAVEDCDDLQRHQLKTTLMGLHPWRKGPFELFGLHIDTEWRSDWKWDRLAPHLPDITGYKVLDVGCGNGYHCLRLYGAGAERVIGIDPSAKFVHQFYALKKYAPQLPVDVLPLGIEHIPENMHNLDLVLSMGVIYHRKDPESHIRELLGCLKPGGTLVLETLVVDDSYGSELRPENRYAKMRNVWCVPSPGLVQQWLEATGLEQINMVDCTTTSTGEQRATEWMTFESLPDFLAPDNPHLTIEGYPAPKRAIFIAKSPL